MCWPHRLRRRQDGESQLGGNPDVAVAVSTTRVAMSWLPSVALLSPNTFDSGSGSQQVRLHLLFKIIPSVRDENAQIVGTLFHAK